MIALPNELLVDVVGINIVINRVWCQSTLIPLHSAHQILDLGGEEVVKNYFLTSFQASTILQA